MSTLNIKDPETYRLVRQLAAQTGETLTAAVREAVRERLAHMRKAKQGTVDQQVARWSALARTIAAMPELDSRPADEILGYNDTGSFG